jgi:peptidoglycan/LPS O-acetylase OafA/YrhL
MESSSPELAVTPGASPVELRVALVPGNLTADVEPATPESEPGDRSFRPDVEGLRGLAIALVLAYHAAVPHLAGGYVGVDVFYVISGFVITGVLLRAGTEQARTTLLSFYARRARRIIPAAVVVIVLTTLAAYHWLGFISGDQTADDGRWASMFLANLHFSAIGTNYLASQTAPSPLQNFWSLAVEEQFYLVFPALFLLVSRARSSLPQRPRLAVTLGVVVIISFTWCVSYTNLDAIAAYFSPFTRAWELALGALVAVMTPQLARIPTGLARAASWIGLAGVIAAAALFNAQTAYPGAAAALPVVSTALVIAGGTRSHRVGAAMLLDLSAVRFVGRISYSLYLWHWPILTIVAEYYGSTQPWRVNLIWILVAFACAVASYFVIERPIRTWKVLARRPAFSVGLGLALSGATLAFLTVESVAHG